MALEMFDDVNLEVSGLSAALPDGTKLDDVTFSLTSGVNVAVIAEPLQDAALLIGCLAQLVPQQSGTVRLNGQGVAGDGTLALDAIGLVAGPASFPEGLKVRELVDHVGLMRDEPTAWQRVAKDVDLERVGTVSVNELGAEDRHLLRLACAGIGSPRVLLLENADRDLSLPKRRLLYRMLRDHRSRGGIAVITADGFDAIEAVCDVLVVIWRGRLLACEKLENLILSQQQWMRVEVVIDGDLDTDKVGELDFVSHVVRHGDRYDVFVENRFTAAHQLLGFFEKNAIALRDLHTYRSTLRDVVTELFLNAEMNALPEDER